MKQFILASASPRRKEILEKAGLDFEVIVSDADENVDEQMKAKDFVAVIAKRKADAVAKLHIGAVVLGCDTIVVLDGEILQKPKDENDAIAMLGKLSGNTHQVYTGVCVTNSEKEKFFVSETSVEFYTLSAKTIENYVATHEPMDKAGSYGIQAIGSLLVKKIDGDYFSVMGLPVAQTARVLGEFGVDCGILENE